MKAIILAAGLGTRMAPLSARRSKAALPVLDRSLLARQIDALAARGIERVVVNTHAHAGQIREEAAAAALPVDVSHEPVLLGSGGGILRAARFLAGPDPFLVLNADMCVEFSLHPLLEARRRHGAAITLLLRDDPRQQALGSIGYGIGGRVCRITQRHRLPVEETGSGLYTGIQLMSGDIFERFPAREDAFELVPEVWVPQLASGAAIAAVLQESKQQWEPVGSPRELLEANLAALHRLPTAVWIDPSARVAGEIEGPVWVGAGARVEAGARIGPDAVVGARAQVPAGCRVRSALLLPGAAPARGEQVVRAIAFDGEVWRDA